MEPAILISKGHPTDTQHPHRLTRSLLNSHGHIHIDKPKDIQARSVPKHRWVALEIRNQQESLVGIAWK